MRTIEEIKAALNDANHRHDVVELDRSAAELDAFDTELTSAMAFSARGAARLYSGDNTQALEQFTRALELFTRLKHVRGIATIHVSFGNYNLAIGDYESALNHYEQATGLYKEINDESGVVKSISYSAIVHQTLGDSPKALAQFSRVLDAYEAGGQQLEAAGVMNNIGILYNTLGEYLPALVYFQRALAIYEEHQHDNGCANVLGNLGMVHAGSGDIDKALDLYNRSYEMYELALNRPGRAATAGNIGTVFYNSARNEEAEPWLRKAVEYCQEVGARHQQAFFTELLCGTLYQLKRLDEYHDLYAAHETLMKQYPDVAVALSMIEAKVHIDAHEYDAARNILQSSLERVSSLGEKLNVLTFHRELRDLARVCNDFEGFIKHNDAYTAINDEIRGGDASRKFQMQVAEQRIEAERKEHQKHLAVLHATLPKHIADRVIRGEVVNDHIDNAAVMFLDIVGFTTLSSTLTSQQVITLLDAVFKVCDEACAKHNVTRVKTIGDSYMAVAMPSHVPQDDKSLVPRDDSAARCCSNAANTALEIIQQLKSGERACHPDGGGISVRIGLHCGPVTAGVLGTERLQYDVWGDTVNVASRMESTSEPNRIHVSETFARSLAHARDDIHSTSARDGDVVIPSVSEELGTWHLALVERGTIDVKGKGPMKTFWLEGVKE